MLREALNQEQNRPYQEKGVYMITDKRRETIDQTYKWQGGVIKQNR